MGDNPRILTPILSSKDKTNDLFNRETRNTGGSKDGKLGGTIIYETSYTA